MTTREGTRQRLVSAALALFGEQGYEATTAAQIAAAAGVTEMTFFRHFSAKERVLLDDPYDPLIADGVAAQPRELPPIVRASRGVRRAWRAVPEPAAAAVRERIRIVAATPRLRGAMWRNTAETERVVADQLVSDGTPAVTARVAAAAVLAAVMAALLQWAQDDDAELGATIAAALDVIEQRDPR